MAEYQLSYTASEINTKLGTIDETKASLENNYYTSTEVDTKITEINTSLLTKADIVDGKVPVEQLPDDIGGGVESWNDLTDKPFYETGWSIEWDGTEETSIADPYPVEAMGATLYKLSNETKTRDDFIGTYCKVLYDGEEVEYTISSSNIQYTDSENCFVVFYDTAGIIVSVLVEGIYNFMGIDFNLTEGIWFVKANYYVAQLGGIKVKTIDKKFIPSEIGTWANIPDKPFYDESVLIELPSDTSSLTTINSQALSAIGGTIFSFVKVSDAYFNSPEETYGAKIKWTNDGSTKEFTIDESYVNDLENGFTLIDTSVGFAPLLMSVASAGTSTIPSASLFGEDMVFNVAETGIYFLCVDDMATTDSYENGSIKQIDKKYIPSEIGTWANMPDKPFGESGYSIEWDGTPTSEFVDFLDLGFYKVSDVYFEAEDLAGGTFNLFVISEDNINSTNTISSDIIEQLGNNCFGIMSPDLDGMPAILITSSATTVEGINFPSAGIWFLSIPDECYTNSLEMIQIKKIDKKFIPDDIGTWEAMPDKPFDKTSTLTPIIENKTIDMFDMSEGAGLIYAGILEEDMTPFQETYNELNVLYKGTSYNVTKKWVDDMKAYCFGNLSIFNVMGSSLEDTGEPFAIAVVDEVLFMVNDSATTQTVTVSTIEESIKTLDKKYIPSEIGTWANMSDKPFGETGWSIEWDGVIAEGTEVVPIESAGVSFVKVSDTIISDTEVIGGTAIRKTSDGSEENEFVISEGMVNVFETGSWVALDSSSTPLALCTKSQETIDFMGFQIPFTSGGMWFPLMADVFFTSSLSKDYSLVKIDKKFIPDDITAAVSLTFDETPTEGSQNPVKSMGIHSAISALEGKITSTFCYKGTVANYTDLPTSNNVVGDVWNITNVDEANGIEAGDNVAWDGTGWDILAGIMDLSDYYTKTEVDSISLNGVANLANYYTKAETDSLIANAGAGGGGNVNLSNYYTKSETDSSLALKADLINGKVPLEQLPEDIGNGGSIVDCPTYTGGQILNANDLNNLIVINYYKLLASMTADYKFDMNEALYNINSNHFTISFITPSSITSDNDYITIKIATGYSGSADSADMNSFTSNISIELNARELKRNSWYTAYCIYNEAQNKWTGYLISAASDTSDLESNVSSLQSNVSSLQSNVSNKQDKNLVTSIDENSTDEQYPSAKLLYDIIGDCDIVLNEINALIGE